MGIFHNPAMHLLIWADYSDFAAFFIASFCKFFSGIFKLIPLIATQLSASIQF
jgi:hypothetical protein